MSCLMFINGSHLCSKNTSNENSLCHEHNVKIIKTDTCNICLSELNEYVYIQCGHSFHKECINEWLSNKKTCPCCRKIVREIMSLDEIFNCLNQISLDINEYGNIRMTRDFIEWIFEMSRIYISDISNISLMDILYVVQLPNNFDYYFTVYSNEINNVSIDLFELELKLNNIVNSIRNYNHYLNEQEASSDVDEEDELIDIEFVYEFH